MGTLGTLVLKMLNLFSTRFSQLSNTIHAENQRPQPQDLIIATMIDKKKKTLLWDCMLYGFVILTVS